MPSNNNHDIFIKMLQIISNINSNIFHLFTQDSSHSMWTVLSHFTLSLYIKVALTFRLRSLHETTLLQVEIHLELRKKLKNIFQGISS